MLNYTRLGEGEPVVLLHGLFGGSGYWSSLQAFLSETHDVISVDLPGFAGSAKVPVPASIAEYGSVIVEFLNSLSLDSFNLLGHSLGGAIAQQITLDNHDKVNRLVAYATKPAVLDEDRFESFEKTMDRILTSDINEVVRTQVTSWLAAGTDTPSFELCFKVSNGVTTESAAACLRAIRGWDIRDRLHQIAVPTLIVSGDRDRSVSLESLVSTKQAYPNGQLAIVPNCAHMAHLENPACYNTIVQEFFRT